MSTFNVNKFNTNNNGIQTVLPQITFLCDIICKDVFYVIFSYLNRYDILNMSLTNKRMRRYATQYFSMKNNKKQIYEYYNDAPPINEFMCSQYDFTIWLNVKTFLKDYKKINIIYPNSNVLYEINLMSNNEINILQSNCENCVCNIKLTFYCYINGASQQIINKWPFLKSVKFMINSKIELSSDYIEEIESCIDFHKTINVSNCSKLKKINFLHKLSHPYNLPLSITHIELTDVSDPEITFDISSYPNLKKLVIDKSYSGNIICSTLSGLDEIIIKNNMDYSQILPKCHIATKIIFDDLFDRPLTNEMLPNSVEEMHFLGIFNKSVNFSKLPKLKKLEFGDSFDHNLNYDLLPLSIESIKVGSSLKYADWSNLKNLIKATVKGDIPKFPVSIQKLYLGHSYNCFLTLSELPNLRKIVIYNYVRYDTILDVSLCSGLKEIIFNDTFNLPINIVSSNPSNIEEYYTFGLLPNTIEKVVFGKNFNRHVDFSNCLALKYVHYEGDLNFRSIVNDPYAYKTFCRKYLLND